MRLAGFRRRHLVPVPSVGSMTELNDLLERATAKDDRRHIAARRISVGEHFTLEAPTLKALPAEVFDITTVPTHRVDRKSRVSVRCCFYSVAVRYVARRIDVRVGADTIEIVDGTSVVARHVRGLHGEEILALGPLPRSVGDQTWCSARRHGAGPGSSGWGSIANRTEREHIFASAAARATSTEPRIGAW